MTAAIATSFDTFSQGFLLCASIIVAFGPQNLFLLRHGLRRKHLLTAVLFSVVAEIVLVSLGIGGLSALIFANDVLHAAVSMGGIFFLLGYGTRSLLSAFRSSAGSLDIEGQSHSSAVGIQTTIIAALGFALLNPAAYVDTLMIIGAKSTHFPLDQRAIFGIGVVMASTLWFCALTFGASKLSPIFGSKFTWRALDVLSGFVMLIIASSMLFAGAAAA